MIIYHITQASEWQKAQAAGQYTAPSLTSEGFIHASTREQYVDTANRYYAGQQGLVLLSIDTDRVRPEIRYEPGVVKGQTLQFPHIYGPLNLDAVTEVKDFAPGPGGVFSY